MTIHASRSRIHRTVGMQFQALARRRSLISALSLGLGFAGAQGPGLRSAHAQVLNAQIQGVVLEQETGSPLAGATVTIQGPALPDMLATVSDAKGRYVITQIPPGDDYVVSFYFGASEAPVSLRSGLRLSAARAVTVDARLMTRQVKNESMVIREAAPNIDVANANTGVELDQELLRQTPLRGRSYQSGVFLAPGANDVAPRNFNGGSAAVPTPGGEVGVGISGATGAENAYLVDGVNTTDPAFGIVSTDLSTYFVKELTVLTGGYQAEYGRATGGIISVVTKSGSNELHGGLYGSWVPYQVEGRPVARLGEAIQTRSRPDLNTWDLGFDLGGAIWRDRIWFYGGFAYTSFSNAIERRARQQVLDGTRPRILSDFSCPTYLSDPRSCDGPRMLALETQETGYAQDLFQQRQLFNGIVKLQFHFSENHDLFLGWLGSPNVLDTLTEYGSVDVASKALHEVNQVHDVSLRYQGKALGKRLQIDLLYAMHYQSQRQYPALDDQVYSNYLASADNPYSLADFEDVPDCRRDPRTGFNPCPVTQYTLGLGFHRRLQELQRHQALAGITYFARFLGLHAFKAGFDFEYLHSNTEFATTGPSGGRQSAATTADGSDLFLRFGLGGRVDGRPALLDSFSFMSQERNFAVYLRDSWSIASSGLVLNLGVRWEGMQLLDGEGQTRISLLDNIAPRVGAVWDFTRLSKRPGRGKLFANYGRYYESIRLDLGRAFSGQANYGQLALMNPAGCPTQARQPGGRPLPVPGPGCSFDTEVLFGGSPTEVVPGAKASAIDEVTAGVMYDVGYDLVIGASYIYRSLSNVLEDFSVDQGSTYFIGTPGLPVADSVLQSAAEEAARLKEVAERPGASAAEQEAAAKAQTRLDSYRVLATYPRPQREYHALVLTASKRLSNRFSFLASYTFSQTTGNYPGVYSSSNGQLSPHASSQFDFLETLANRQGPLPTDRPHNFKLTGFYQQPIGSRGQLTAGLTFTAISGRPIEVLGAHPLYGPSEVFILPRGAGGRTPMVHQFDLHLGYEHTVVRQHRLAIAMDVLNLFNQRQVTNVDDNYTYSPAAALTDAEAQSAFQVRSPDGSPVVANSNYGQPTAFQAPLYLRLSARYTF